MKFLSTPLFALSLAACDNASLAQSVSKTAEPSTAAQRGDGRPYELLGTAVFDILDPASGRTYQLFIDLPKSYQDDSSRHYPVVYVTDVDFGFPMLRLIGRRINLVKPRVEEFILVGLSYAKGESGQQSRRRDYTLSANGPSDAPPGEVHGGGAAYRDYLKSEVMPYVDRYFRTAAGRNYLVGHSYDGLLGAQILVTEPDMFAGYVLGSPSFFGSTSARFSSSSNTTQPGTKIFQRRSTNISASLRRRGKAIAAFTRNSTWWQTIVGLPSSLPTAAIPIFPSNPRY